MWQDHPANKITIPTTKEDDKVNCKICTDGSKTEKNVGAAFIILNNNKSTTTVKKYKHPDYSSTYDAEVTPIHKAI